MYDTPLFIYPEEQESFDMFDDFKKKIGHGGCFFYLKNKKKIVSIDIPEQFSKNAKFPIVLYSQNTTETAYISFKELQKEAEMRLPPKGFFIKRSPYYVTHHANSDFWGYGACLSRCSVFELKYSSGGPVLEQQTNSVLPHLYLEAYIFNQKPAINLNKLPALLGAHLLVDVGGYIWFKKYIVGKVNPSKKKITLLKNLAKVRNTLEQVSSFSIKEISI